MPGEKQRAGELQRCSKRAVRVVRFISGWRSTPGQEAGRTAKAMSHKLQSRSVKAMVGQPRGRKTELEGLPEAFKLGGNDSEGLLTCESPVCDARFEQTGMVRMEPRKYCCDRRCRDSLCASSDQQTRRPRSRKNKRSGSSAGKSLRGEPGALQALSARRTDDAHGTIELDRRFRPIARSKMICSWQLAQTGDPVIFSFVISQRKFF
jgi:hypothetical protein